MRGRHPKPTAVKELAGNPGHRPVNEAEPKPRRALPQCPKHLTEEARHEWRRVARDLYDAGLLTSVDRAGLAMYCQTWATWVKAEQECEASGEVIRTSNGNEIQNPWRGVANKALKLCQSLAAEFGMTPSSRTRVKSDGAPKELSLAEQLFAGVKASRDKAKREAE